MKWLDNGSDKNTLNLGNLSGAVVASNTRGSQFEFINPEFELNMHLLETVKETK